MASHALVPHRLMCPQVQTERMPRNEFLGRDGADLLLLCCNAVEEVGQTGESHISVKGELVLPKRIGSDCNCKLKCYQKVDENTRQRLFKGYYSLKTYDEQNAYLFGLIKKQDVKRKKNLESDRRTCTYKYHVRDQGKEIQVCKLAFAHIHAVSFRKIRTLSEKLDQNILFPRDGRGRHNNRPTKVSLETVEMIKNHIFQVMKSSELKNFLKEDKNKQMTPELNVAKLHTHYLQMFEPEAINMATETTRVGEGEVPLNKTQGEPQPGVCRVTLKETLVIPSGHEVVLQAAVSVDMGMGVLETNSHLSEKHGIFAARVVVSSKDKAMPDADEAIGHIAKLKREDKERPTTCEASSRGESYMSLWAQWKRLEVHRGLLYRQQLPGYQPRVKNWLYRKVFHDEFKSKDFQTLKRRLEVFMEVPQQPKNNMGPNHADQGIMKAERDDKTNKKSRRKGTAKKLSLSETPISMGYVDASMTKAAETLNMFQQKTTGGLGQQPCSNVVHFPIVPTYNTQNIQNIQLQAAPKHHQPSMHNQGHHSLAQNMNHHQAHAETLQHHSMQDYNTSGNEIVIMSVQDFSNTHQHFLNAAARGGKDPTAGGRMTLLPHSLNPQSLGAIGHHHTMGTFHGAGGGGMGEHHLSSLQRARSTLQPQHYGSTLMHDSGQQLDLSVTEMANAFYS
uniref:Uncharacterized protein n=1 Tax=Timema douglasi TaxID=61478 RepID=A0A7R8VLD6_TIMDO|nr:unnamed protein product [Timema douglasi]